MSILRSQSPSTDNRATTCASFAQLQKSPPQYDLLSTKELLVECDKAEKQKNFHACLRFVSEAFRRQHPHVAENVADRLSAAHYHLVSRTKGPQSLYHWDQAMHWARGRYSYNSRMYLLVARLSGSTLFPRDAWPIPQQVDTKEEARKVLVQALRTMIEVIDAGGPESCYIFAYHLFRLPLGREHIQLLREEVLPKLLLSMKRELDDSYPLPTAALTHDVLIPLHAHPCLKGLVKNIEGMVASPAGSRPRKKIWTFLLRCFTGGTWRKSKHST